MQHDSHVRMWRAHLLLRAQLIASVMNEREYDPNVAPCDDAEFGMKP